MFTLGIIGEYLARMYGRAMERPAYVVLERRGHPERGEEAASRDAATARSVAP
jgi:hypothetical protein